MPGHRAYPQQADRRLLLTVAAIAASWSGMLHAESICTFVTQSSEHPIPLDERESLREVQSRVLSGHLADGDRLAAAGQRVEAYGAYRKVFEGFQDKGVHYSSGRCLPADFYQRAADKLKNLASEVFDERIDQGIYEDGPPSNDQSGALRLLLVSNQYDAFIEHGFEYAAAELFERDTRLPELVQRRLVEIDQMRRASEDRWTVDFENDLTPLLDEELAVFDKLSNFNERLKAHLAPLYPTITDHWLTEESKNFAVVSNSERTISKGMLFGPETVALGQATDALKRGLKRLSAQPVEVIRLQARASDRGDALMKQQQFRAAELYFKIADNDDSIAIAGRQADEQESETAKTQGVKLQSILDEMQKSDEEQSEFQDEAEEMGAEFEFELEQ